VHGFDNERLAGGNGINVRAVVCPKSRPKHSNEIGRCLVPVPDLVVDEHPPGAVDSNPRARTRILDRDVGECSDRPERGWNHGKCGGSEQNGQMSPSEGSPSSLFHNELPQ